MENDKTSIQNAKNAKTYNGFFPQNAVLKFHNESFGIENGIASINVFIKGGEYAGFTISVKKESLLYE